MTEHDIFCGEEDVSSNASHIGTMSEELQTLRIWLHQLSIFLFHLYLFHKEKTQNSCVMNSHFKTAIVQVCGDTFSAIKSLHSLRKLRSKRKILLKAEALMFVLFQKFHKKLLTSHIGQCVITESGSLLIAKNQNYPQATITGSIYSIWQVIKYPMNLIDVSLESGILQRVRSLHQKYESFHDMLHLRHLVEQ